MVELVNLLGLACVLASMVGKAMLNFGLGLAVFSIGLWLWRRR